MIGKIIYNSTSIFLFVSVFFPLPVSGASDSSKTTSDKSIFLIGSAGVGSFDVSSDITLVFCYKKNIVYFSHYGSGQYEADGYSKNRIRLDMRQRILLVLNGYNHGVIYITKWDPQNRSVSGTAKKEGSAEVVNITEGQFFLRGY